MLADGGDCLADVGALGDQQALFGDVASTSTAFRLVDRIASDPAGLERLRAAHACARARARVWQLAGAPGRLTIDLDATLISPATPTTRAPRGTSRGGFGFHPLLAYADQTGGSLASELRAGNAGANTATDQSKWPSRRSRRSPPRTSREILLRVDSAGASHELLNCCREGLLLGRLRPDRGGARRNPANPR